MNIAIILSGGTGSRLGADIPKQYIKVGGRPILMYCVQTLLNNKNVDKLVVCLAEEWRAFFTDEVAKLHPHKEIIFSEPGEVRQLTIYNALTLLKESGADKDDIILIHDAARPLLSDKLICSCFDACLNHDAVLPVIPVKDTIYRSVDGRRIDSLPKRQELYAGQAPEAFKFGKYFSLHKKCTEEELKKITGSTQIAYDNGCDVVLVRGEEINFKVTTPEDLSNFESIIKKDHKE